MWAYLGSKKQAACCLRKMQKPLLEPKKAKQEKKMNVENASLVSQLLDSMGRAVRELEKSLERNDYERFKKSKEEILKFQKQISDLLL